MMYEETVALRPQRQAHKDAIAPPSYSLQRDLREIKALVYLSTALATIALCATLCLLAIQ